VSVENGQVSALPRASDFDPFTLPELEAAIRRSQDFLLREQKPEGYWIGELMVDCTLVADMVAYHHWNKSVDEKWQRKAVNQIFSLQLPTAAGAFIRAARRKSTPRSKPTWR
jgi:squalene cyclase